MRNIFVIARKELLSTFRQRNLLFIMFLSPILLVMIMGLAFSGIGGSGGADFADIRLAVVNLDEGFNLQEQLPAGATNASLNDLAVMIGGQNVNVGALLLQNDVLGLEAGDFAPGDFSMNFGDQLSAILLSESLTDTDGVTGIGVGTGSSFDLSALTCPLLPEDEQGEAAFSGSLDDLFDAEMLDDVAVARAGVLQGDYAAAVIIPADFSSRLIPVFGASATNVTTETVGLVKVIANDATPISGSIVRAVVKGIVGRFARVNVALNAVIETAIGRVNTLDLSTLDLSTLDPSLLNLGVLTSTLQGLDSSVLEPLGCLIMPGANNIQVRQQPLDETQERSTFSILMVTLGGAQAIFFALFTGVFGINAIYEDRRQGTLQRVLASPTPSSHVLWGRLLGNLVVVASQLLILLTAFTVIASIMDRQLTFIWGTNIPALLLVVVALSLFTTGLGVLVVGLANSPEQVQIVGPMVTILFGALGGTFGGLVPRVVGQFSPSWWGVQALQKLSANEIDIGLNLLVVFGVGIVLALAGTFFFRRRMGL